MQSVKQRGEAPSGLIHMPALRAMKHHVPEGERLQRIPVLGVSQAHLKAATPPATGGPPAATCFAGVRPRGFLSPWERPEICCRGGLLHPRRWIPAQQRRSPGNAEVAGYRPASGKGMGAGHLSSMHSSRRRSRKKPIAV